MSDADLAEYFIFEEGTWWDYVTYANYADDYDTSDINIVDDVEDATTRVESLSCKLFRCFTLSEGQIYIDYYIEDGRIYMNAYDGYDADDLLVFSLDGIEEQQLNEIWGFLFGFESLSGYESSLACEVDFGFYTYNAYEGPAVEHICTAVFTGPDGIEYRSVGVEYYLEGVGKVSTETKLYEDGEWQITYNTVLVDTSIDLEDVDSLTPVEEETDGKEVIDTVVDEMEEEDEEVEVASEEATFPDVDSDHDNYSAIEYLYDEGVIGGYDDGSFKPGNTVNRAELLKILVEGQGITPDADTYKNCFPDVTTDWYAKYVCYAKEEGWVSGYDDGFFRPADSVNKVEALKMLLNSQDIETDSGTSSSFEDFSTSEWFAAYVAKAEDLGILEENGSSFHPDDDRTRAGIAEELYRLLTY